MDTTGSGDKFPPLDFVLGFVRDSICINSCTATMTGVFMNKSKKHNQEIWVDIHSQLLIAVDSTNLHLRNMDDIAEHLAGMGKTQYNGKPFTGKSLSKMIERICKSSSPSEDFRKRYFEDLPDVLNETESSYDYSRFNTKNIDEVSHFRTK